MSFDAFVVDRETAERLDHLAMSEYGVPGMILMENAGLRIAEQIALRFHDKGKTKVIIVSGRGNNGGDGFVVARHLHNKGFDVRLWHMAEGERYINESKINLDILRHQKLSSHSLLLEKDLPLLERDLSEAQVVVDGLFGIGLNREVTGLHKKVVELMNSAQGFKVAIDIPSGLDANTGMPLGCCFRADLTLSLGCMKKGLLQKRAAYFLGEVKVLDISIPKELYEDKRLFPDMGF